MNQVTSGIPSTLQTAADMKPGQIGLLQQRGESSDAFVIKTDDDSFVYLNDGTLIDFNQAQPVEVLPPGAPITITIGGS